METRTLEERVIDLLYAIPEIKELTSNPSIFSDDIEGHDCDKCPAGEYNQGDTFDQDVCMDCWTQAIKRAFEKDEQRIKDELLQQR